MNANSHQPVACNALLFHVRWRNEHVVFYLLVIFLPDDRAVLESPYHPLSLCSSNRLLADAAADHRVQASGTTCSSLVWLASSVGQILPCYCCRARIYQRPGPYPHPPVPPPPQRNVLPRDFWQHVRR
eukprot:scaffold544_cov320-Pavlova_lutheri.AAC.73